MNEKTRSSVFQQVGKISYSMRERLVQQKALTIWLAGLSASGKSTTAYALEMELAPVGWRQPASWYQFRFGV